MITVSFANGLPPLVVNNTTTPWTFNNGVAQCTGVGLPCSLELDAPTNVDQHTVTVRFKARKQASALLLYKRPVWNDPGATTQGSICSVGFNNSVLTIYRSLDMDTLTLGPVIASHKLIMSLAINRMYALALKKVGKTITVSITDVVNGQSESFTYDNEVLGRAGACYGRMGVAQNSGAFDLYQFDMEMEKWDPTTLIYGDSITEGTGTSYATCYAKQVQDALGGNVWISGDGGTTSQNVLHRLQYDLQWCMPERVCVLIGANDANGDGHAASFMGYLQQIHDLVIAHGAVPYFGTVLPTGAQDGGVKQARINGMNLQLLASGWNIWRADQAVGLNGDGAVYDPAKMFDITHPNTAGHAALAAVFPKV